MFPPGPGKLIVSCQPSAPDSPLNAPDHMVAMAIAAEEAGAVALRVESPHQIISVKSATTLPVIGLWKRADERGRRVITPDLESAKAVAAAGADVIAIAATADAHPTPARLAQFIRQIQAETGLPVMADVSTVAEGIRAAGYGADMVATTLSGYTPYSPAQDGPDLLLVRELAQAVSVPVVAEGRYRRPEEARAALAAGAAFVTVGGAITAPDLQTARFVAAMEPAPGPPTAERYWAAAAVAIASMQATQGPAIREAAALFARAILAGGMVHIFGTGHSRAFGMELSGRAGGLVPMHAFGLEEAAPPGRKGLQLLDLERSADTAHKLLASFPVSPADLFVIASNSGRNGCPVELALAVKRLGHPLITVTSLAHAGAVSARHPSGKRVFEVADVVIDNAAPYGDAALAVPEMSDAVCAVSSVTGALIAQALTAETIRLIREAGVEPPVYRSANVDGADEHNARLEARYQGRL
jgi:uncharacterized phosphosugar-binding protein/putative N-acetylmannosamine-6-phosphate epimerase